MTTLPQIEQDAVNAFIAQAAAATPAQRQQVLKSLEPFATERSRFGTRPVIGGHKVSIEAVQAVIDAMRAM